MASDISYVKAYIDQLSQMREGMNPNEIWSMFLTSKELMHRIMIMHHVALLTSVKATVSEGREVAEQTQNAWTGVVKLTNPYIRVGNITVDISHQMVHTENSTIALTQVEFKTLMALVKEPGSVVSRDTILAEIGPQGCELRMVDTYISRLRTKLGRDSIQSIRGVGYKIAS